MNSMVSEQKRVRSSAQAVQTEPQWPNGRAISLPQFDLRDGRAAMLAYFENTWALTETLFSALDCEEAYFIRPYHLTRHPLIFYYLHPVTFYVNKLIVAGLLDEPVNPHFEILFETGVDEMSWDDLHEGEQSIWPDLDAARAYRQQVYSLVRNIIETHPLLDETVTINSPAWALVMCFEHERIHLETSSVLMRELPVQYLHAPDSWPALPIAAQERKSKSHPVAGVDYPADNVLMSVAETTVNVGKPHDWPSFGWDNEYGSEKRKVPAFKAGSMLISNGEYFEFVRCGAYLEEKYWCEQGWSWRQFRNTRWPTFWVADGPVGSHRFKLRTIFEIAPMQWDWPVVANYYEAKAYCAWRTDKDAASIPYRLLQEKEHLALRDDSVSGDANLNLQCGSERPVQASHANRKGFHDVQGNVWQWCEDTFHPLPGFKIHPYYVDFSTPCFDERHQMIHGGSFISTGDEASKWARFHFRPHFFQHAGFRLVQGGESREKVNKYEEDEVLNQYMLFHWGSMEEQRDAEIAAQIPFPQTEHFMLQISKLAAQYSSRFDTVLDLGCAVGRASFELARHFNKVIGLDYSKRFIDTAEILRNDGSLSYSRLESGLFRTQLLAEVDPKIDRSKVNFVRGDAGNLSAASIAVLLPAGKGVDAVVLSNLLCRLPDPAACLQQFVGPNSLLEVGGILVIASPNSWMEQYTDSSAFLDGPDNTRTLQKLASLLPGFTLEHQQDLPFLIREHRRKYEYVISQVSIWRKTV